MSLLVINANTLTAIANAIRGKTGGVDTMTPLEMPDEITNIPTGGGGIDITQYTGRGGSVRTAAQTNTISLDSSKEYFVIGFVRLNYSVNIQSIHPTITSDGTMEELLNNYAQTGTQLPYFYAVHVTNATYVTVNIGRAPQDTGISAFYKE